MKASEGLYNKIDWLDTGFTKLNAILGGGIASRKITEISGVFSVGKSTLALQIVAQAQKAGMDCLWSDSEFSFGTEYAEKIGVDCDELDLEQNRFAEDALDAIEAWADSHKNALIVLDSVGHLLPRTEAEKESGGKVIGGQARLIATFCRKIVPILAINNIALIMLNHNFIDVMSGAIKTSGGEKLAYSKSVWLMLRKTGFAVKQGENQVGEMIEASIRKNKLADTNKQKIEMQMLFGKGFNSQADLIEEAILKGIIEKKGNSFFFEGEKVAVGMGKLRTAFEDSSFAEKITQKLS